MSDIYESIIQTLTILRQAASAELNDSEEAMELYLSAAGQLAAIQSSLPSEYTEVVRKKLEEVKQNIENLRRLRWMKDQPKFFPEFSMQFVRIPIPVEDFSPPSSSFFRVFWLMKIFYRSIQQGAFFTPSLYVPKEVWYQEGSVHCIRNINAKQRCFSGLSRAVSPLTAMHSLDNVEVILDLLGEFKTLAVQLIETLDEELGTRKSLEPAKKGFWASLQNSLGSTDKEVKYEQYLVTCTTFFDQCQMLERLHVYFSEAVQQDHPAPQKVLNVLLEISKVLYSGPCKCMLRDMVALVDRYHHKSRKTVCDLLPVELKVVE